MLWIHDVVIFHYWKIKQSNCAHTNQINTNSKLKIYYVIILQLLVRYLLQYIFLPKILRFYQRFACVFKSFYLKHDIAQNTKFTISSTFILEMLSLRIFHKKLNICHATCSRIGPSSAMPSSLLGAPIVLDQMRFVRDCLKQYLSK